MSDFETIPASPEPEKPQEEKKTEFEDWGAEPPAPEPDFLKNKGNEWQVPDLEAAAQSGAQAVESAADAGAEAVREAAEQFEVKPEPAPAVVKPAAAQPVTPEPEVLETPVYVPQAQTPGAPVGEPPKKTKWWLIVLIVLVVLCLCCVITGALIYAFVPMENDWNFEWSLLRSVIPV
jgi:hypothetical protein